MSEAVYILTLSAGSFDMFQEQEVYATTDFKSLDNFLSLIKSQLNEASDSMVNNDLPKNFPAPRYFHTIVDLAMFDNQVVTITSYILYLNMTLTSGKIMLDTQRISLGHFPEDQLWDADDDDIIDTPVVPYEDIETQILGD